MNVKTKDGRDPFVRKISEKTGKIPKERRADRAARFYKELMGSRETLDFLMNNPELTYSQIAGKKAAVLAGYPDGKAAPPSREYVNERIAALEDLKRRIPADMFMKNCGFYLTYAFAKHPETFNDVPEEVWRRAALSPYVLKEWKRRRQHASDRTQSGEAVSALSAGR